MARFEGIPGVDRFEHERVLIQSGARRLAGIDEAGRGPLAGPVVAAAVMLPASWVDEGLPEELEGLNDSKQLTAGRRERYHDFLTSHEAVRSGVACIEADLIDSINILRATHRAMVQALGRLIPSPDHVLVDGLRVDALTCAQTALVRGDALSFSIAAASVIAKVTRDRLMLEYDAIYPGYGFARNKGYGTAAHLEAVQRHGPSPIHRRSFAPLRPAQAGLFACD